MSLGTGALKVGREPERLRIRKDQLKNASAREMQRKSQDKQKAPAVTPQITYA